MKVKDLIKELQELQNQDMEATVCINAGCHGPEDWYNIDDVHEYEPSKDYSGAAFIEIDKGCMCHGGSKTTKYTKEVPNISEYYKALEDIEQYIETEKTRTETAIAKCVPKTLADMAINQLNEGTLKGFASVQYKIAKLKRGK